MAEREKFIDELKKQLAEAEKEIKEIDAEISKARSIGLDVSKMVADQKSLKDQIALTKSVYAI